MQVDSPKRREESVCIFCIEILALPTPLESAVLQEVARAIDEINQEFHTKIIVKRHVCSDYQQVKRYKTEVDAE